jgi:hypothetical protein
MNYVYKCDTEACKYAPAGCAPGECHGKIGDCIKSDKFEPLKVATGECNDGCIHAGQETCITPGIYSTDCFGFCGAKGPIRSSGTLGYPGTGSGGSAGSPVYEGDLKHVEGYEGYNDMMPHTEPDGELYIKPEDRGDDMKHDTGKTDMSLLEYFPLALEALCKVSEKGCIKYTRGSFDSVPNGRRRYTGAMQRHYYQEGPGDTPELDEELQLPHDFMVMWNAVCRVELRLRGQKLPKD